LLHRDSGSCRRSRRFETRRIFQLERARSHMRLRFRRCHLGPLFRGGDAQSHV
jgi:hypothetical protein